MLATPKDAPVNHTDHVRLIANGVGEGGVWAEMGAGAGAFTLALRDVAGPAVQITAVDDDAASLAALQRNMDRHFPQTQLRTVTADFSEPLTLPPLDGILAANSIHYVRDAVSLLMRWRGYLLPQGRLVVVEYDTDHGNRWVPYPLSFQSFARVAPAADFSPPLLLGRHSSRFLNGFYAALTTPVGQG